MRFLLLALAVLSLPYVADALVDYRIARQQHGYSPSDVSGVNRIIERETRPVKHKVWVASEHAPEINALFGREGVK
jgi:hypothetical protein